MTRQNNEYEQGILLFGIIIAIISALVAQKLGSNLLDTAISVVKTIGIVIVCGVLGRYFFDTAFKTITITLNLIWFSWHATFASVNNKIIAEYNNSFQFETIQPELIWYGESWFIWIIQLILVLGVVFIFYINRSRY
jgi:hypothetical protein